MHRNSDPFYPEPLDLFKVLIYLDPFPKGLKYLASNGKGKYKRVKNVLKELVKLGYVEMYPSQPLTKSRPAKLYYITAKGIEYIDTF